MGQISVINIHGHLNTLLILLQITIVSYLKFQGVLQIPREGALRPYESAVIHDAHRDSDLVFPYHSTRLGAWERPPHSSSNYVTTPGEHW